jgi:hypothetical protein
MINRTLRAMDQLRDLGARESGVEEALMRILLQKM